MEKKPLKGEDLKERLKAAARDRLHRFLLSDGEVRGALVNGTRVVREMRANHDLGVLETLILGHAYLGGLLVASTLKGKDRVVLQIECSGPVGGLVVEANACGEVRGYLKNVPIPVDKPLQDSNLAPFFGAGFLSLTRYLEDAKQPFTGKVALRHGRLAQDLAHYYLTSEQIPTAFNLSIKFTPEGEVAGAGGLFLQVMPDASEATAARLEEIVYRLPSLGELCADRGDIAHFLQAHFGPLNPVLLDQPRVEFFCRCRREQVARLLGTLPMDELQDICDNGPFPVELRCHNCNTVYHFSREDVATLHRQRSGQG